MAFAMPVIAEEVTVNIDRVALLTPPPEEMDTESNRIAVFFEMPVEIESANVFYSEVIINLDFSGISIVGDDKVELQARNITDSWSAEDADWNGLADDIDTLSFYTYTFDMDDDTEIHLDVTMFVMDVAQGSINNYGLMLIPHKFDQWAYQIDPSIVSQIGANARLRIVYD
jgi:hypothetical protein